jgi:lysyl-tRNA synthetase class 2
MSIEVSNITKIFGEQKALDDLSFSIEPGQIVGFLGPNGAGKSTMMKILTCFIPPTSGQARVNGYDVMENSIDVRRVIGYLPENNPLYTEMYVKEYLEFVAGIFKISNKSKRVEEMIEKVAIDLHGTTKVKVGEHIIDFKRPWKRYTMYEAISHFTGFDISAMDEDDLVEVAAKLNIKLDPSMGKGKIIDEIFGETCEPNLIQPTFITDYPIEMSPLAKKHRTKDGLVERFEAIVNGKELCNSFSELNDPIDQRKRFEDQLELGKRGDQESMLLDEDFLRALEYGMPPTAGLGVGIDRLAMIMTNSNSIQDVLLFPHMRPEKKKTSSEHSEFLTAGIPEVWINHIIRAGYSSPQVLKESKATQIHQTLNSYRKKNKLQITALSLREVEAWLEKLK